MPLSPTGRKIKRRFVKQYGPKKGASYFYAMEAEHKLTPKAFMKVPRKKAKRRKK